MSTATNPTIATPNPRTAWRECYAEFTKDNLETWNVFQAPNIPCVLVFMASNTPASSFLLLLLIINTYANKSQPGCAGLNTVNE